MFRDLTLLSKNKKNAIVYKLESMSESLREYVLDPYTFNKLSLNIISILKLLGKSDHVEKERKIYEIDKIQVQAEYRDMVTDLVNILLKNDEIEEKEYASALNIIYLIGKITGCLTEKDNNRIDELISNEMHKERHLPEFNDFMAGKDPGCPIPYIGTGRYFGDMYRRGASSIPMVSPGYQSVEQAIRSRTEISTNDDTEKEKYDDNHDDDMKDRFLEYYHLQQDGIISVKRACDSLNISRTVWYRLRKRYLDEIEE